MAFDVARPAQDALVNQMRREVQPLEHRRELAIEQRIVGVNDFATIRRTIEK
jgi:hypothetical protein